MTATRKASTLSKSHLAAIYVHAGAGYHSVQNENIHLNACADAAKAAMAGLKTGGSALDAVELAIKSLENNEVTNAGYGSNLTVHGQVEGDATIVDHLGRSGAVGAISQVANPIHVARQVYERSITPMVLRRVPPNLLVGDGAVDFAHENSVSILPNEMLVSHGAKDRFKKWKKDIEVAEGVASPGGATVSSTLSSLSSTGTDYSMELTKEDERLVRDYGPAASRNPTVAALANESQAFSPSVSPVESLTQLPSPNTFRRRSTSRTSAANGHVDSAAWANGLGSMSPFEDPFADSRNDEMDFESSAIPGFASSTSTVGRFSHNAMHHSKTDETLPGAVASPSSSITITSNGFLMIPEVTGQDDMISDTVGAIAVDIYGNIAAASSSGGIGMKHKGRVGPAALVGIGTAVLPIDDDDRERTTVACVTSGTGEHMATSLAASTCAQRLYSSTKVGHKGMLVHCSDDEAMSAFIKKDFMGHPSVKHSTTGGAIGTMAVKKDRDGMWLLFAHNTDSFALASMHAHDSEPHTVMSRSSKYEKITTGGRSMRPIPVHSQSAPLSSGLGPRTRSAMKKARLSTEDTCTG